MRVAGARPSGRWISYSITRSGERYTVEADGKMLASVVLRREQPLLMRLEARDLRLWVDDLVIMGVASQSPVSASASASVPTPVPVSNAIAPSGATPRPADAFSQGDWRESMWSGMNGWSLTADPDGVSRRVAYTDSTSSMSRTLEMAGRHNRFTLSFRARYSTVYPQVGPSGTGDGQHFPHWKVVLAGRQSVSVEDSYIWNGLLLQVDGKAVNSQSGSRPQAKWVSYTIERDTAQLRVLVDGRVAFDEAVPAIGPAAISFVALDEKLWLDDVRLVTR